MARSGAGEFEAGAGGGVDGHAAAGQFLARRQDERCRSAGGFLNIGEQRAGGGEFGRGEIAPAIQRGDAEAGFERGLCAGGGEISGGAGGAFESAGFGDEQFGGRKAGDFAFEFGEGTGAGVEGTGGEIEPRQSCIRPGGGGFW